jgi:predicted nucleic acid-binding OB-fold protein
MTELLRVDIESVSSSQSLSNFSKADLDLIADRILESGGLLKPLVLKKTGFEKYEVVDGHFEYYAALRAYEKNPHAAEVNALIIPPESEKSVVKQVEALKVAQPQGTREHDELPSTGIEVRIKNTESQIENQASEIRYLKGELLEEKQSRRRIEEKLRELESQVPKKIEPLEVFNTLSLVELTFRLRSAGFADKTATKIAESVERERKKNKFVSLSDVVSRVKVKNGNKQIKGINGEKMVAIIDSWSRLLFS